MKQKRYPKLDCLSLYLNHPFSEPIKCSSQSTHLTISVSTYNLSIIISQVCPFVEIIKVQRHWLSSESTECRRISGGFVFVGDEMAAEGRQRDGVRALGRRSKSWSYRPPLYCIFLAHSLLPMFSVESSSTTADKNDDGDGM
jgi:hypothetical protein